MRNTSPLLIVDIPWLRLASHKNGAHDVPHSIASKLLAGGFVTSNTSRTCLTITRRGELALTRLA